MISIRSWFRKAIPIIFFTVLLCTVSNIVCVLAAPSNGDIANGGRSKELLFAPLPATTISSISPDSGPLAGGTKINITGTGFISGAMVIITAENANIAATNVTWVSATSMTATTPAGTAGTHDVVVTNPDGQYAEITGFTYLNAPTVTSISPTSGSTAGGGTITITGTNFVSGSAVTIGGTTIADVSVVSSTSIKATTLASKAGPQDVVVTTPGGSATLKGGFNYVDYKPTVVNIIPNSGPTAGGTPVTVAGTYFVGGATVTIGGITAQDITVVSSTSITAITPALTAGNQDVVVTVPGGSSTLTGGFTYVAPAPKVISISPGTGLAAGGTSVTINGTGFVTGASVMIGGTAASYVTVLNSTLITATTPVGTAGEQDVMVTNPDGQFSTLAASFTYFSVVNGVGSVSLANIVNSTGVFAWSATLHSSDDNATITIPPGTIGKTQDGLPLSTISVTQENTPPANPAGANIDGVAYDFGPTGATFNTPITMTNWLWIGCIIAATIVTGVIIFVMMRLK